MNTFELQTVNSQNVGALSAQTRETSEIQASITIAKRFPRDEIAARLKCSASCARPSFAERAAYSFPRGGSNVTGPSVDLARELARCWGNINYGLRIVEGDDDTIHIKGFAFDIETNNRIEMEDKFAKLVQRKSKKTGITEWVTPDERDLRELMNRRGAILVRNALLQLLPPDLIDDALNESRETMRRAAAGELGKDRESTVKGLAKAFAMQGVTIEMLEQRLGHELKLISDEEVADLRGIYKSISDGHTKRADHFEFAKPQKSDNADALNARLEQVAQTTTNAL